jgi:oligopeptide transport system substrate-binding protein
MVRLLAPVFVLVLLSLSAILAGAPPRRADLTILNRGDVSTLDVTQMSWLQDFRVASMLFEGLTRQEFSTGQPRIVPGVAESWEASPDARTYTFRLRGDARWSNGEAVTAHDFIYSWRRSLLPENGADYAKLFHLLRGGAEFYRWRAAELAAFARADHPDRRAAAEDLWRRTLERFDREVGLSAPDDRTLRVELERPVPYFLDLAAFAALYPQYPPAIRACERVDPVTGGLLSDPGWAAAGRLVSNGPMVLEAWRFKREMRLTRNPDYWDKQAVRVGSVLIPSIADGNAQVIAFRTGAVDWTSDVTPGYRGEMLRLKAEFLAEHREQVEALRAQGLGPARIDEELPRDPRNIVHAFPSFGTYFYNFNCRERLADGRPNPFADPRVRRAFARTVDKRAIVGSVRRIGEPVIGSLVPPGSIPGYETPRGLEFDPALAARELAEAGYPGGRGFPPVELLFNREGEHDLIAQAAARDWERHLGVRVRLEQKEVRTFREAVKSGAFMISRASWFGDYADPTTFLDINRTGDGNNDRGYSSEEYDGLLSAASDEADPKARLRLLERAEVILVERDLPLVPLFQYSQIYLYEPWRLRGMNDHPLQTQHLERLERIPAPARP